MGNMHIGAKAGAEWSNKGVGGPGKGGYAEPIKPTQTPIGSLDPIAPAGEPPIDLLNPFITNHPIRPVEPCIGLQLHSDPVEEIKQIRSSKGMTQLQALVEFKDTLSHATDKGLEKAQAYLTNEMAKPYNNDDELLGTLLKAVNKELNSRHSDDPILKPFPFEPAPKPDFPHRPWNEHSHGNGNERVAD